MTRVEIVAVIAAILAASDEIATTVHNAHADDPDDMWDRDEAREHVERAVALLALAERHTAPSGYNPPVVPPPDSGGPFSRNVGT